MEKKEKVMKKSDMQSINWFSVSATGSGVATLKRGKAGILGALLLTLTILTACGGGTSSSAAPSSPVGPPPPPPSTPNALPVTVNSGNNSFNVLSASVTVCIPGTSTCQTINNVQVDTGSTGLRLFASTLSLSLPQINTNAGPSFECGVFPSAGVYTWGPMVTADVQIAGESAP